MSLGTFRPVPYGRASAPTAAMLAVAERFGISREEATRLLSPTYAQRPSGKPNGAAYRSHRAEVRHTFAYSPIVDETGQRIACTLTDAWRHWAWKRHERKLNATRTIRAVNRGEYVETIGDRNARLAGIVVMADYDK